MDDSKNPKSFLPLTTAVLHILLALADGRLHGYGIAQKVGQIDSSISMGPGTLYGTIKRMLEDELIAEEVTEDEPPHSKNKKRYYYLTDLGESVLSLELSRLDRLTTIGKNVPFISYSRGGTEPTI